MRMFKITMRKSDSEAFGILVNEAMKYCLDDRYSGITVTATYSALTLGIKPGAYPYAFYMNTDKDVRKVAYALDETLNPDLEIERKIYSDGSGQLVVWPKDKEQERERPKKGTV